MMVVLVVPAFTKISSSGRGIQGIVVGSEAVGL